VSAIARTSIGINKVPMEKASALSACLSIYLRDLT